MGMLQKAKAFLVEVAAEMGTVSWPIKRGKDLKPAERYRELIDSTTMVIVSTIVLAAYIGLVDTVLSGLMGLLIG